MPAEIPYAASPSAPRGRSKGGDVMVFAAPDGRAVCLNVYGTRGKTIVASQLQPEHARTLGGELIRTANAVEALPDDFVPGCSEYDRRESDQLLAQIVGSLTRRQADMLWWRLDNGGDELLFNLAIVQSGAGRPDDATLAEARKLLGKA